MSTFWTGTKNELKKLFLKRKYIVLLILAVAVCLGRVGITTLASRLAQTSVTISSNLSLEMAVFVFELLIPLIAFMATTDVLGAEIQEDTIKASLVRPISRLKLLCAKVAGVFIMCAVFAFAIFIACTVLQLAAGAFRLSDIFNALLAYIIDMIPVLALILTAVLLNLLLRSPTLIMVISIGAYIIMKYFNLYGGKIGYIFYTGYLQWHRIWLGTGLPIGAALTKSGIVVGTGLILFTLSYLLFDKKEF